MIRRVRCFVLPILFTTIVVAWPAQASAQRRAVQRRGTVGAVVPRAHAPRHYSPYYRPYYRSYYPRYYSYPRYYYPPYYSPWFYGGYSSGFSFGFGFSLGFGVPYRYGYPYPYRYPYAYPSVYPYPYSRAPYPSPSVANYATTAQATASARTTSPTEQAPRVYQAPTQNAFGALIIRVRPSDATIVIDGETWNRSDGDGDISIELAEGPHQVEIRRAGHGAYARSVDVRSGRRYTLNVSLAGASTFAAR